MPVYGKTTQAMANDMGPDSKGPDDMGPDTKGSGKKEADRNRPDKVPAGKAGAGAAMGRQIAVPGPVARPNAAEDGNRKDKIKALEEALAPRPESLAARLRKARNQRRAAGEAHKPAGERLLEKEPETASPQAQSKEKVAPSSGNFGNLASKASAETAREESRGGISAGAAAAALPSSDKGTAAPQVLARLQAQAGERLAGLATRSKAGAARFRRSFAQILRYGLRSFWRGLRRRTKLSAFAQDYRTLQALLHRYVFDRDIEQLFFVPTWRRVRLERLTIASPHGRAGHDYRATPRLIFDWAVSLLPPSLKEYTFFDIGAGRGRVLLLAARYNFEKVRGVEFAAELHDNAEMNIAQFPRSRMKCRDVECWHMDALDLEIPSDKLVFYFFDPFSDAMLQRMMSRIVAAYRAAPRSIYLVFVDPPSDEIMRQLVEESNIFTPLRFGRLKSLLIHYLSPAPVRVYKTNS